MLRRTGPLADVEAIVSKLTRPAPVQRNNNLSITTELLRRIGIPVDERSPFKFVHIAGTKGKGSTSFTTAQLLQRAGLRVGLFTSPHLVDVRERCLINGEMINESDYARMLADFRTEHDKAFDAEPWDAFEQSGVVAQKSSFFRFMFLFALRLFAAHAVDVVVLEVGVGGRLDSTNAVTPSVCAITALGYDHCDILGDTIELIAGEKAGIIKAGVPCFSCPQSDYPQTLSVIQDKATAVGAPLQVVDEKWFADAAKSWEALAVDRGQHMVENSKLALALYRAYLGLPLKAPVTSAELDAIAAARYPGRSQIEPPIGQLRFYLDGAHTPESVRVAAQWFFKKAAELGDLTPDEPRATILFFSSRDNRKLLSHLIPFARHIAHVRFVHFPHNAPHLPDTGVEHLKNAKAAWESLVAEHPTSADLAAINADINETPLATMDDLVAASVVRPSVDDGGRLTPVLCVGSLYLIGAVVGILKHRPAPS